MANTLKNSEIPARDIFYFRQSLKNRIFQSIVARFAELAKKEGLTKKDLARKIGKDPSRITRWLNGTSNLELETVSDLLLGMDAELRHEIVPLNTDKSATYNTNSESNKSKIFYVDVNQIQASNG